MEGSRAHDLNNEGARAHGLNMESARDDFMQEIDMEGKYTFGGDIYIFILEIEIEIEITSI